MRSGLIKPSPPRYDKVFYGGLEWLHQDNYNKETDDMHIVEITRLETSDKGTFGVLTIDKEVLCFTMELPWRANRVNISCIPDGVYTAKRKKESSKLMAFGLNKVYGRSNILIHVGNYLEDTCGCILLGMQINALRKEVCGSMKALTELYERVEDETFKLIIKNNY